MLGQHVMPLPAGVLGLHAGAAMAAADALRVVLYGEGGHGSQPETTVDPVRDGRRYRAAPAGHRLP